jgi:hypothetical protein
MSPQYKRLDENLDKSAPIKAELRAEGLSIDEEIKEREKRISRASEPCMYYYEIGNMVDEALCEAEKMHQG